MAKALDKSLLPRKLRELTILTVGATWKSQFEWYVHARTAKKEGLSDDVIEAIRTERLPAFKDDAQRIVYEYSMELQKNHQVSDETYNAARNLLGSKALVELTVLIGHYTNVSMTLNAHEGPLPDGVPPQF
jgi:4-carboxymuconolactone decarboxylase